jgi:hypothetical protein
MQPGITIVKLMLSKKQLGDQVLRTSNTAGRIDPSLKVQGNERRAFVAGLVRGAWDDGRRLA